MNGPVLTLLDMKKTRMEQGRTALARVSAVALAVEYFTEVEVDQAAAASCKECLRVIETNNTVYITPEVFALIHKRMKAKEAVKYLLLPNL